MLGKKKKRNPSAPFLNFIYFYFQSTFFAHSAESLHGISTESYSMPQGKKQVESRLCALQK